MSRKGRKTRTRRGKGTVRKRVKRKYTQKRGGKNKKKCGSFRVGQAMRSAKKGVKKVRTGVKSVGRNVKKAH